MQKLKFIKTLPVALTLALFLIGPACSPMNVKKADKATEAKMTENVFKGKILGVSKKAKTISIEVGKKTEMVKFSDTTKGMEFAQKGEAAIIKFSGKGSDKIATVIKPKLAKLPEGVKEMQPDELVKLVAMGLKKGNYFLVDSRPAKRFAEGSIPTAVSIPVSSMKEKGKDLLPPEKDKLLIFFCGGPT